MGKEEENTVMYLHLFKKAIHNGNSTSLIRNKWNIDFVWFCRMDGRARQEALKPEIQCGQKRERECMGDLLKAKVMVGVVPFYLREFACSDDGAAKYL